MRIINSNQGIFQLFSRKDTEKGRPFIGMLDFESIAFGNIKESYSS